MNYYDKSNSQLVAHCFFSKGEVEYHNFDSYYAQEEGQKILDRIEMKTDY